MGDPRPDSLFTLPLEQHLLYLFASVLCLAAVDKLLITPYLTHRVTPQRLKPTRWFFTHAFANAVVCVTGAKAIWTVFSDPHDAMDFRIYHDTSPFGSASVWPLTVVNAVHIYHMVGGFGLTGADYFHHLLFIPLLGLPGQVFKWGAVEPAGACFISGCPGGVAYFMLGLQKLGMCSTLREKRWTANLNTWIRVPGILINSYTVYLAILYGNHVSPLWAAWLHVFLPPYNALYYNKQAIGNFAVHYMTHLLSQDDVVKEKMDEMKLGEFSSMVGASTLLTLKEAISVPQQGS